jgi:hypothetical protein
MVKMTRVKEVRNRVLGKPEVLKEYEALRAEFQVAKMTIAMQKSAELLKNKAQQ